MSISCGSLFDEVCVVSSESTVCHGESHHVALYISVLEHVYLYTFLILGIDLYNVIAVGLPVKWA